METVSFDLELVTPMFMGGAEPQGAPEFRAASLKGLLRFWFRAIYPGQTAAEERLFGTTAGQSPVRVITQASRPKLGQRGDDRYAAASYLGYGVINYDKQARKVVAVRPFFDRGSRFRVELVFSRALSREDKEKILRAFWALSMLGGLGSRSRRGFGAYQVVAVQDAGGLAKGLPPWVLQQREQYVQAVRQFLGKIQRPGGLARYSHFSAASRLLIGPALESGEKVLTSFNNFFQQYRSYYDDFKTGARKTTGPPKADHDLMWAFLNRGWEPRVAPARAAFGLPHNYYFKSSRKKAGVDLMEGEAKGRRASPLFFHVQGLEKGQACGVVLFLPAQLIPPGKKLTLSGEGVNSVKVNPPDFEAIESFLQAMMRAGGSKLEKVL